jgi:predicted nucleotidyltransferase
VDIIKSGLRPLPEQIDSHFIFEAMARGAENEGSNIDLMLVGNINFVDVVSAL